jgi:hypothetical protein
MADSTRRKSAMTTTKPPPSPKTYPVREVTRQAYDAILADSWPSHAGVVDFGIDSPDHLGALQYEFRTGRVTVERFDDAIGWGPALTGLIGDGNPYRGVSFQTLWDKLMMPIGEWASVTDDLFPLGRLNATPEVLEATTRREILDALSRHATGDWGDGDKSENDAAVKTGGELVSRYRAKSGHDFFIRTWSPPPMTLVLLDCQLDR